MLILRIRNKTAWPVYDSVWVVVTGYHTAEVEHNKITTPKSTQSGHKKTFLFANQDICHEQTPS